MIIGLYLNKVFFWNLDDFNLKKKIEGGFLDILDIFYIMKF